MYGAYSQPNEHGNPLPRPLANRRRQFDFYRLAQLVLIAGLVVAACWLGYENHVSNERLLAIHKQLERDNAIRSQAAQDEKLDRGRQRVEDQRRSRRMQLEAARAEIERRADRLLTQYGGGSTCELSVSYTQLSTTEVNGVLVDETMAWHVDTGSTKLVVVLRDRPEDEDDLRKLLAKLTGLRPENISVTYISPRAD